MKLPEVDGLVGGERPPPPLSQLILIGSVTAHGIGWFMCHVWSLVHACDTRDTGECLPHLLAVCTVMPCTTDNCNCYNAVGYTSLPLAATSSFKLACLGKRLFAFSSGVTHTHGVAPGDLWHLVTSAVALEPLHCLGGLGTRRQAGLVTPPAPSPSSPTLRVSV
jgi:hypothetical protein